MPVKRRSAKAGTFLFLLLLIAVVVAALTAFFSDTADDAFASGGSIALVIDPGHGGFDGGAVSDDGTKESDLNLAIALRMRCLAELLGIKTVLTRADDAVRTDYAAYSEREDLQRRTEIINDTPGAILISVHQNDYPTAQPSGAQVLYSASEGSEALGQRTHSNLIRLLDPNNRRVAAPAPKSLYITSHVDCPAILVECGFMSNNFDVLKLCDEAYQTSVSLILIGSLLQYLNDTETA